MNAIAQSLPPVAQSSGIDWFLLLGIAAIVGVVVLVIYLKRKSTTVTATGATVSTDAAHLASVISTELGKFRTLVETKVVAAPAPVAAPAVEPAAVVPLGKQGVAGVLTMTTTGDAKTDTAAFNALYFG